MRNSAIATDNVRVYEIRNFCESSEKREEECSRFCHNRSVSWVLASPVRKLPGSGLSVKLNGFGVIRGQMGLLGKYPKTSRLISDNIRGMRGSQNDAQVSGTLSELAEISAQQARVASTSPSQASEEVSPLSDHVIFNDERLAKRYASEPIPISTLYEAYFEGAIDVPGDLMVFLRRRSQFVKHKITRQHLQWAITNFVPDVVVHSRDADARATRELFDDRGDDFYRFFLGEKMAFTCARFGNAAMSLENAVDSAHARVAQLLQFEPEQRILELGCDWGAFLQHSAEHSGITGVGYTLSQSQARFANDQFHRSGVGSEVEARVGDYRDLPEERFDRIVCLESVERVGVKHLKSFFEILHGSLKDKGQLFLQWTGLRRQLRPEDLMWGLFMNKYIVPGADSALPLSSMLKVAEKAGWEVQGVSNQSNHYAQTLSLWRRNWAENRQPIVSQYGERWFRIWTFFLAWSELIARQGSAASFQVVLNRNLDSLDRLSLK